MERGRTELLRSLGILQAAFLAGAAAAPFAFAIRRMGVDFLRAAAMDDVVTVETTPVAVGGASIDLTQRVLRGADVLAAAEVRVACVAGGRAFRLPKTVRAALLAAMVTAP